MNANKNLYSVTLSEAEGSYAASPACSSDSGFIDFAQNDKLYSHVFICVHLRSFADNKNNYE